MREKMVKDKLSIILIFTIFICLSCGGQGPSEKGAETTSPIEQPTKKGMITIATTTSTYDSGLLDYLNPKFTEKTGIEVRVVSMGTGAAFRAGEEGNADLILVHDTEGELKFVEDGFGINRRDVMYNDFIIIGPHDNPAGLAIDEPVIGAMAKIAATGVRFISRGDDSGTHRREQKIWMETGLPLDEMEKTIVKKGKEIVVRLIRPSGDWYQSIGQGMGAALNMANEMRAYVLTDRGTYLAYKGDLDLIVLNEGGPMLVNQYGIILINPEKNPSVKRDLAIQYIDWITSQEGQALIGEFKVEGEILFRPNYSG
jgi:tungstate transport system substrate-binding protein